MYHLKRKTRVVIAALIACTLASCAPDRVGSPMATLLNPRADDFRSESALRAEIGAIQRALNDNDFYPDLDIRRDAPLIQKRRDILRAALADFELKLTNLQAKLAAANFDGRGDQSPPNCFFNGTLDDCFWDWYHTTNINGSGHVVQSTYIAGGQSASISIVDNGTLESPIYISNLPNAAKLDQPFTFPAPNCNTGAHTLQSTADHMLSMSLLDQGSVSGHTTSSYKTSCSFQGLIVTMSPPTIGENAMSNVQISGMTQCSVASVTSSNPNVATVQDFTNNNFGVMSVSPGSTVITASCGSQVGSATLVVDFKGAPPNPDDDFEASSSSGESSGSGGGCPDEYTYLWWHRGTDGIYRFVKEVCIYTA